MNIGVVLNVNSPVLEDFGVCCFFGFFYFFFTATLGAVFGLSTCLSAQVREEPEDPLNYFIGGCAAGAVLGVRGNCGQACVEMYPCWF